MQSVVTEDYQVTVGDQFAESVQFSALDELAAATAMAVPTRVSLHLRDFDGGTVVKRVDSAGGADSPDGTLTITDSGDPILLAWAMTTTGLTPGKLYYGDLQLIGASGFPNPWTPYKVRVMILTDNTEVTA